MEVTDFHEPDFDGALARTKRNMTPKQLAADRKKQQYARIKADPDQTRREEIKSKDKERKRVAKAKEKMVKKIDDLNDRGLPYTELNSNHAHIADVVLFESDSVPGPSGLEAELAKLKRALQEEKNKVNSLEKQLVDARKVYNQTWSNHDRALLDLSSKLKQTELELRVAR